MTRGYLCLPPGSILYCNITCTAVASGVRVPFAALTILKPVVPYLCNCFVEHSLLLSIFEHLLMLPLHYPCYLGGTPLLNLGTFSSQALTMMAPVTFYRAHLIVGQTLPPLSMVILVPPSLTPPPSRLGYHPPSSASPTMSFYYFEEKRG